MRSKRQLFSAAGFPPPVTNNIQDEQGISYTMVFGPEVLGAPSVAYTERQSIRQLILKQRRQWSIYLSRYRVGMQAEIGYPIARGATIINSAPSNIGRNTGPNQTGTMRPNPRFNKALPTPIVPYNPPVY